ncbi:MAG: methionine biosynthesis protein MetW [Anaerolineae bacterium]
MLQSTKQIFRRSPLRPIYLWLANSYRRTRRLFIYPPTAQVGVLDYDVYWDSKLQDTIGQLSEWRRRRAHVFTDLVSDGDRVLDLGVGDGALLHYMLERKKIAAFGLDVSPKAVEFCRAQGLDVVLADINKPIGEFLNGQYDYIICSEIIEHLPDPEGLLNNLRPYVRKGIIVSIPNTGFYHHRLRLLFGRFPLQWVVTPGEHLRYWTRTDFRWWAGQLKFTITREIPYEGTPVLKDVWPSLFAAAFVYVLAESHV